MGHQARTRSGVVNPSAVASLRSRHAKSRHPGHPPKARPARCGGTAPRASPGPFRIAPEPPPQPV